MIPGIHHYLLFLASGILLNLTPGQDTLYIVGRSVAQGRKAGMLSALGISSGSVIHTLAAAFGLSALLATSAVAFVAVKIAGALYLVYLGVRMWILPSSGGKQDSTAFGAANSWQVYWAGLLTNVLNPKVAVFFLAFLPQFIDPAAPSKLVAFLILGATFITTGTIWCLILALAAAEISARLSKNGTIGNMFRRATGAIFVGLGIRLAISD